MSDLFNLLIITILYLVDTDNARLNLISSECINYITEFFTITRTNASRDGFEHKIINMLNIHLPLLISIKFQLQLSTLFDTSQHHYFGKGCPSDMTQLHEFLILGDITNRFFRSWEESSVQNRILSKVHPHSCQPI